MSKEGETFEVPIAVAKMSKLVDDTLGQDDDDDDDEDVPEIPIPNVTANVLAKVLEYCTHYKTEPMTTIQTPLKSSKIEDLVQPWYAEYVNVEQVMLFELCTAANFMDIKPLLDLACLAVSIYIKVRVLWRTRLVCRMRRKFSRQLKRVLILRFRVNRLRSCEAFSTLVTNLAPKKRLKCARKTAGCSFQTQEDLHRGQRCFECRSKGIKMDVLICS